MRKTRKGGSGILTLLLVFALLVAGAYGAFRLVTGAQERRIKGLEDDILALQEEIVPLRFMITDRREGRLYVRIKLYDLAGGEYAVIDRDFEGTMLFLDFLAMPAGGAWFCLPYRVFTERVAPSAGLELGTYLLPEGRLLSHQGAGLSEKLLSELAEAYRAVAAGGQRRGVFGNAVHDLAEIKSFERGIVYKVVARKKGGIELLEE